MRNGIKGSVLLIGSHLAVWEEPNCDTFGPYRDSFKREVFDEIIRHLRRRGWKVGPDAHIVKHHNCLAPYHRYCVKRQLEAKLELSGRCIKFEMYQNVANITHPNGGEYEFNKLEKMPYLLRKLCELERLRLHEFLVERFGYTTTNKDKPHPLTSNTERLRRCLLNGGHRPTGEPCPDDRLSDHNRRGADGVLSNGSRVWFTDEKGRWLVGRCYHHINNMWWVLWGRTEHRNICSRDLRLQRPENPRVKDNARQRRRRLEQLMQEAAKRNEFLRAEQLRRVLFGDAPTFRIRHTEKGYYHITSQGYAHGPMDAGQYTEEEARFARGKPDTFVVEPVRGAA